MKQSRFLNFILLLILIESMIVGGDMFSRRLIDDEFLFSGLFSIDFSIFSLMVLISIGLITILLFKKLRLDLGAKITGILKKRDGFFVIIFIILVLLMYEAFQDLLFIYSDTAAIHYQGYFQILINNISFVGWIFLVCFQLLFVLIGNNTDLINTWMKEFSRKKWIYVVIISAAIIIIFNHGAFGTIPQQLKTVSFEELNSPLIGLQVFFVGIAIVALLMVLTILEEKARWVSKIRSDLIVSVLLILVSLVSWYSLPLKESTFVDTPRSPNYENYPKSDALIYELSANRLLVGNGTERASHAGFWYYLAAINYLSGGVFKEGNLLQMIFLSLIPALLYLMTKSISDRLSGLVVALLFIIRESNALILVEYITIPQIKNGMTEPVTILAIALTITLLATWLRNPNKNAVMLLIAGGVFGWVILLRIETIIYIPVIGFGLLLMAKKSWKEGLRITIIFSIGFMLIIGPWIYDIVRSTGSILSIGLGKESYFINSINEYTVDRVENEVNDHGKQQLFPYNLENNLMQLLYYFPSNHQPMLTLNNLPDVFTNKIDYSDFEEDSYREKYLERYVRSLPYWWNDWDGHIELRSIIPLFCSIFLIFLGYSQIDGRNRIIALILLLMTIFQSVIYSFVGRSGGRIIQVVDWIPMIFYGIGISWFLRAFLSKNRNNINDWWIVQQNKPDQNLIYQKRKRNGMIITGFVLFMLGLSLPIAENFIPPKFTDVILSKQLDKLSLLTQNNPSLSECLSLSNSEFETVIGKAIYPRLFKVGEDRLENDYKGISDYSFDRVEFFLVGTENIWVIIPSDKDFESLPHGSEVLVIGKHKNNSFVWDENLGPWNYLDAECVIFIADHTVYSHKN